MRYSLPWFLHGLNWFILVNCFRTFGVEVLEKLMFANWVVCFRLLLVVPLYFPKLFQSSFLSFFSSSRKDCWSCCIHVNTTKLKVSLFCWKIFFFIPNWTWLQCLLCTVLLKSTSSISVALPLSSGFLVCRCVKMSCKSGVHCFNELFKCIGCNSKVTRTFTNSYPTYDWMNSWNSKLWPLSTFPVPKSCLAIEFAITYPVS